jgi:2-hydroxychromene-2-carboxylate isomerase
MADARFYFDLASPYAYLAAERLAGRHDVEWEPVLLGAIFGWRGRGSWAATPARAANVAEIERRAASYGLPPIAWPPGWPADSLKAMRAALWAGDEGRPVAFALAAFRRAFRRGEDIGRLEVLRAAAGDIGLDADKLAQAIEDPAIKARLKEVTTAAYADGVTGIPTVAAGGRMFYGDDRLDEALAALDRERAA